MSKRRLPPANRVPTNTAGMRFFAIDHLLVGSWGPLPDGQPPQTEVHLQIHVVGGGPPLIMRFKNKETLDLFIEQLQRHRYDVWPAP